MEPAVFSLDRQWRYLLRRRVGPDQRTCLFVMLNPSTADESNDDPTVRRCIGFAKEWGFGLLEVCNLFAWRTSRPDDLSGVADPVGLANDLHLSEAACRAHRIVAAWGNRGQLLERAYAVRSLLKGYKVLCLGLTGRGEPKHPLYVPKNQHLKLLV